MPKNIPYVRRAEGIRSRGKTLYIQMTHKGRRIYQRLSVTSITEAKKIRDGMRANLDRLWSGQDEIALAISVNEAVSNRISSRSKVIAEKTLIRYREHETRISEILGMIDVRLLTPKDIREYQAQREKQGAAPKTINNELQLLHSAILSTNAPDVFRNQEFRDGWKMPEPEADENVHIYSDDEIKLILANATAKWLPNFATVALWTGCRPGELCQITKSDINLEKKTVTFKAITVKGKRGKRKTRHVRLLPPAIEALKNQIEISQDSVYVFPSPRNKLMPLRIETVTEAWAKTMKKVKLEGRFYDLRHTAITRMLEAGMDSRMIREISGHTTTRMIDLRYSHVGSSGVARALDEFYIKSSTLRRQPEILAKA